MPPAARITDMHTCPMQTPAPVPVPHVGGPILPPGAVTVLIGKMPAARVGDMCVCVGPPDSIVKGSATVMICKMPAARMGDTTAHGGSIVAGCPTVMIGDGGGGGGGGGGAAGAGAGAGGSATSDSSSDSSPDSDEGAADESHFLDVRFVDKGGRTIKGVDYRIKGGKVDERENTASGRIHREGVESGDYELTVLTVKSAGWSKPEADVGEKVELTVETSGLDDGEPATLDIYMRDRGFADQRVAVLEAETSGDKIEAEWELTLAGDFLDRQGAKVERSKYTSPTYYFIVRVAGMQKQSSLLKFKDWMEIQFEDEQGKRVGNAAYLVFLSNGEVREGKLDGNGYAKIEKIPPGRCEVQFLDDSAEASAAS